jgi:hypothetical protein
MFRVKAINAVGGLFHDKIKAYLDIYRQTILSWSMMPTEEGGSGKEIEKRELAGEAK